MVKKRLVDFFAYLISFNHTQKNTNTYKVRIIFSIKSGDKLVLGACIMLKFKIFKN